MANIYFSIFIFAICTSASASPLTTEDPTPTLWPEQFHSIVFANHSGQLQLIDFWYDWPNGRNFNIIRDQLSNTLSYSLEWNNGTSFFYDDSGDRRCSTLQLDIGIVRPNWLEGAHYLGKSIIDGFVCNVWEKSQFVVYYEDVISHRPVHWLFNVGRATHTHIMTFEVGAVLDDAKWQVPSYCFENLDEFGKLSAKLNSNWTGYIAVQSANYVSLERFLDKHLTSIIES